MHMMALYMRFMHAHYASPDTIRTARYVLTGLARTLDGVRLDEATHQHLSRWQSERAARLSARTLRTHLSVVRSFYRWALAEGHVTTDPTLRLRSPRVPMLLPHPLPEDRLASALEGADPVMRAMLGLAAFAGLRACEVARLEWAEVYLDAPEPYLRVVGKGSKERIMDLSPELARMLAALPNASRRRGPVFRRADGKPGHNTAGRISKITNTFLREQGVPDTFHSLRHRFVTEVCRIGGLREAQEAAGHASQTTTAGYAAVARRDIRRTVIQAGRILPRDGT